jgi:hypothetical protein
MARYLSRIVVVCPLTRGWWKFSRHPHHCHLCSRSFTYSAALSRHMHTHAKDSPVSKKNVLVPFFYISFQYAWAYRCLCVCSTYVLTGNLVHIVKNVDGAVQCASAKINSGIRLLRKFIIRIWIHTICSKIFLKN